MGLGSCRKLEAELRVRLQQEEARLEQARAQYVSNQELLLQFENGIDNLVIRLHGINVPEQVWGVQRSWGHSATSCSCLSPPCVLSPVRDPWQELFHRTTGWLGLERISKVIQFQPSCYEQGCQALNQASDQPSQGPIQPDLAGMGHPQLSEQPMPGPHHPLGWHELSLYLCSQKLKVTLHLSRVQSPGSE